MATRGRSRGVFTLRPSNYAAFHFHSCRFGLKVPPFIKLLKTKEPLRDSLPQLITCFSPRSRAHRPSMLSSSNPILLSSTHINSLACVLFLLVVQKKGGGKGLKPTQITWLCSFNELMNNCWRAAAAITARSSVCRAWLQVPQLIPQATTTQTALLTPTQLPPLPPVHFTVDLVPHFSFRSIHASLPREHEPSPCQLVLLLSHTSLNFLEASSASVWLSHFPREREREREKSVKVKSEAQD